MSHYYPRPVSGLDMPILRRNNCTNTASGILALLSRCTLPRYTTGVVYSRLEERGYQMLCLCSCSSWRWACQGPKHVEDSNVTHMFILKCALKLVLKNIPQKQEFVNLLGPGPSLVIKEFTGPRSYKGWETLIYTVLCLQTLVIHCHYFIWKLSLATTSRLVNPIKSVHSSNLPHTLRNNSGTQDI